MKVKILQAFNGDCILISFKFNKKNTHILIDGGMAATYQGKSKRDILEAGELKTTIEKLKKKDEYVDLLILTHVDSDHIGGLLAWFSKDPDALDRVRKVWFNSGNVIADYFKKPHPLDDLTRFTQPEIIDTGIPQGVTFENYLHEKIIWDQEPIVDQKKIRLFGLDFRILAPSPQKLSELLDKWASEAPDSLDTSKNNDYKLSLAKHLAEDKYQEDKTVHNGSSIAFILTKGNINLVFLADSHPGNIAASLQYFGYSKEKPLKARLVKLSHHGSQANNSRTVLEMINCRNYVISTNGDLHFHPHKQMLARLAGIRKNARVYFNYPSLVSRIFSKKDRKDFPDFQPLAKKNNEFIFK